MVLNFLAIAGFLFLVLSDWLMIRGKPTWASIIRSIGYGAVACALAFLAFAPGPWWPLGTPTDSNSSHIIGTAGSTLLVSGVIAAIISAALLVWSVFLEIHIIKKKRHLGPFDVITEGTYGVCRHPGFWWFALFVLALGIIRNFYAYFITIFIMIVLDLLLIFIQDRYIFPKVFSGYDDYKKSVPFLIPGKRHHRSLRV